MIVKIPKVFASSFNSEYLCSLKIEFTYFFLNLSALCFRDVSLYGTERAKLCLSEFVNQ
ncbi:hypothetical protein PEPS_23010 [Persicobacter psychrovividus]|uniref:Uncharacterized protein n=1 Tax=Persicobacter psychrovividus TaxID=387638 RepID=A0ABM7VH31_9BACT|nr:hypothetical protein PEPS_23010 [Persicobacter psychrovividus]